MVCVSCSARIASVASVSSIPGSTGTAGRCGNVARNGNCEIPLAALGAPDGALRCRALSWPPASRDLAVAAPVGGISAAPAAAKLRRRSGLGYDFPGMMDERTWRRRPVHQHMSFYGCAHCGARFNGPHAVYVHLAKVHDR